MKDDSARRLFVSGTDAGTISKGSDESGSGSARSPFLTLEKAIGSARSGETILLNGDAVAPCVYKHKTSLTLTGVTLDSVNEHGAVVQATLERGRVITVQPGEAGAVLIGAIIIDGQGINLGGADISLSPEKPCSLVLDKTKITNCVFHGLWTQNYPSRAQVELKDASITLDAARGCIQHRMGAGASLSVEGGVFTVTNQNYSTSGFIHAYGMVKDCSLTVLNPTVDITIGAVFTGEATGAIYVYNIYGVIISGGTYRLEATAVAKNAQAITIHPTRDENMRDCGGFRISDIDIKIVNIPGSGAGAGIWIGHDGTNDNDISNGMLNGGVISRVRVTGTEPGQRAGLLGIAIASHADTRVIDSVIDTASVGFVCKESSPHITGALARNCVSSHFLLKAARPGTLIERSRSVSVSGVACIHIFAHDNPATGNNCAGCVVRGNHCINDGAKGAVFVQIDAGQDVKLSGNNYFNRSGTLDEFPWRHNGVFYATLEEWKAAVEPDATSYDPGA